MANRLKKNTNGNKISHMEYIRVDGIIRRIVVMEDNSALYLHCNIMIIATKLKQLRKYFKDGSTEGIVYIKYPIKEQINTTNVDEK